MIGQTFGHYRITEKLGAGGMGVVYKARDESLERDVALKVLPETALADEHARARFRREALALSQLNHPHICTIYEVGEAAGQTYIAMEYVEGRPLSAQVPADGLPVETALRYGTQIADALAHAHERGVAHRDLKSANVMITPDGRSKVLDFGLAKRLRGADEATRSRETEAGTIAGTLHYMAPEVLRGEPPDERSDLWALGVMLFEMTAGELPFRGQTGFEISSAIIKEPPAPLPPRVPAGLRAIIQRCLAKEPGQRYRRAGEVRAALEAIHSEAAVAPARPAVARRRWPLPAALAVGAALLTLGVWWLATGRKAGPAAISSLAVLPIENLSGDPTQDYFADGITEALIADLARIQNLRVPSRLSVMKHKGTRQSAPEIAGQLKVEALVLGSVVRSGDRVRITAQLVEAATEKQLWGATYDRDLRDILAVQGEVTRSIVGEIKINLSPQEQARLAKARSVNPAAYTDYLRGRFQARRGSKEGRAAAIPLLEGAVATDPGFASGYGALAKVYAETLFFDAPGSKELEEKSYVAIDKALSLDPDSAPALVARGYMLWTPANRFAHERAVQQFRRALTIDPTLDDARERMAVIYAHVGLSEKALEEFRRALEGNPSSTFTRFGLADAALFDGKYEEALAIYKDVPAEFVSGVRFGREILALLWLGRRRDAASTIGEFQKTGLEEISGTLASAEALLFAASGDFRRAEEKIKAAAGRRGVGHFHHTAHNIAAAYALMNKPERAVQWLQVAADEGFPNYPVFERDPHLAKIRQHPDFLAFMATLKKQWEHYQATL